MLVSFFVVCELIFALMHCAVCDVEVVRHYLNKSVGLSGGEKVC